MTRRQHSLLLLACLLVSLFCLIYPIYVIRPFRMQGARELAAALVVMRWRPAVTVLSAIAALVALVLYWRAQPGRWFRGLAVAGAAVVCAAGALVRVNVYELMFHPDDHPSFRAASQTKLDKDEKVLAINVGGAARAYPIRNISYHHIINDVVNHVGIAATY